MNSSRRDFLQTAAILGFASFGTVPTWAMEAAGKKKGMQLGLCTYLWGKDWDLPTLISNCEKTEILGVELRVDHAHKVEPNLTAQQRKEVKARFAGSPVTFLGCGTNEQYDFPDPARLKQAMDNTKAYLQLSHDCGGSGVKVKPNGFHAGVPREKTLEQIGRSLNELGTVAGDLGQQIRLEVHGNETQELPNIKTIMDWAPNKNVAVCWNSNDEDLIGQGLEYNFNLVKDRLGDTVHVRELNVGNYPYQQLMNLFAGIKYKGWVLLEARTQPADLVEALKEQKQIFEKMISAALKS